jgi:hypothetical protein
VIPDPIQHFVVLRVDMPITSVDPFDHHRGFAVELERFRNQVKVVFVDVRYI